jgi:hypothetical protein
MPGPLPKAAAARRRRNPTPGARTLRAGEVTTAGPELPFTVCAATAAWWASIWSSPMAAEWEASDIHGLFMMATLVNDFWTTDDPSTRAKLSTEIRLQGQRFGLSPIDRKRLAWDVVEPAKPPAAAKAATRRPAKPDPRLKAV